METDLKPDTENRINAIAAALSDQKAHDIAIYTLAAPNAIADAFIIATATSRRHAQGLADSASEAAKQAGERALHMEGYDNAQWILVDCNDVIIHIFQEDARNLYRLDDLCRLDASKERLP